MSALTGGGVRFVSATLAEAPRPPAELLRAGGRRSEKLQTVCGWCKKVLVPPGEWVEIEEALARLGLFERAPLPRLTHGICPACLAGYTPIAGGG